MTDDPDTMLGVFCTSPAFATNALMRGSSAEDIQQMNEFLKDNYAPERKGSAFIGHRHFICSVCIMEID